MIPRTTSVLEQPGPLDTFTKRAAVSRIAGERGGRFMRLGRSGVEVSPLGVGAMTWGDPRGSRCSIQPNRHTAGLMGWKRRDARLKRAWRRA